MTWIILIAALMIPDGQKPERKPMNMKRRAPYLVVGHGFAVWEHPDGSCEMFDGRTVYSGVFIAGPRQNWWPDGAKKGKRK